VGLFPGQRGLIRSSSWDSDADRAAAAAAAASIVRGSSSVGRVRKDVSLPQQQQQLKEGGKWRLWGKPQQEMEKFIDAVAVGPPAAVPGTAGNSLQDPAGAVNTGYGGLQGPTNSSSVDQRRSDSSTCRPAGRQCHMKDQPAAVPPGDQTAQCLQDISSMSWPDIVRAGVMSTITALPMQVGVPGASGSQAEQLARKSVGVCLEQQQQQQQQQQANTATRESLCIVRQQQSYHRFAAALKSAVRDSSLLHMAATAPATAPACQYNGAIPPFPGTFKAALLLSIPASQR